MKHLEIEKKFLLYPCNFKRFIKKNCFQYEKLKLEQFYLANDKNRVVRYRKEGDKYIKTLKSGRGLVREEQEFEVSKNEYKEALSKRVGNIIKKSRYKVCLDGKIYEIDIFKKPFEGLVFLEIEFKNEQEAKNYKIKKDFRKFILQELTNVNGFSNKELSLSPFLKALHCYKDCKKLDGSVCLEMLLQCYFKALLKILLENKEAILNESKDIENLHQLRVAIRKSRAILSIFYYLFKDDFVNKFNKSLKSFMQKSNAKRDIDVYLEYLKEYEELLPKDLKGALKPFREKLLEESKEQEQNIKNLLLSKEFEEIVSNLAILSEENSLYKSEALQMAMVFGKKELITFSKKIAKESEKLNKNDNNKSFHKLRIKFKKLRYLAELFGAIFYHKSYNNYIKELKKIQTTLGKHQDLSVQISKLESFEAIQKEKINEEALKYLKKYLKKEMENKREEFFKKRKKFKKAMKKAFEC